MLRFLFDECMPKQIALGVESWNDENPDAWLDIVCVGEPVDLPLSSPDPEILVWAALEDRIVVSTDYKTMPAHLQEFLASGRSSPGLIFPRPNHNVAEIVFNLAVIAHAGKPEDIADQAKYIPL